MGLKVSAALGGAVLAAAVAFACQPGLRLDPPEAVSAGTVAAGADRVRTPPSTRPRVPSTPTTVALTTTTTTTTTAASDTKTTTTAAADTEATTAKGATAEPTALATATATRYTPPAAPGGDLEHRWDGTGPKVVILGDSITVQARPQLRAELQDYAIKIAAMNGEGLSGGAFSHGLGAAIMPATAKEYAADPPAVLVMALGTNDVWHSDMSDETFARQWRILRDEFPHSCLAGVTVTETTQAVRYETQQARRVNAIIRRDADVVVDWAERGAGTTFTAADHIHLTGAGQRLRAALVGDAVQTCLAPDGRRGPLLHRDR